MSISSSGGIYTELDVLLDTHLATLSLISQDLCNEVLHSGVHHTRKEDAYPGVAHAAMKQKYEQRNEVTLTQSMMTNIFIVIRHLFKTILDEEVMTPFHGKLKLFVNVHPYSNLSDEERDALTVAIAHNIGGVAEVELIDMAVSELTPTHCKATYRFMVMYDWGTWMNVQTPAFHQTAIPEVAVIAPAIYHAGSPTEDEIQESFVELKKHFPDATSLFDASEKLSQMLINLHLIDVAFFSVISEFSQTVHTSTLPDIATLLGNAISGEAAIPTR
jgi:hypothetical protein